jgi:hypothetical protein
MLYDWDVPWQTDVLPEIEPGSEGMEETLTLKVLGELDPQVLLAVTEIVPPLEPALQFMDVLEELPLHPLGKDQV